MENQIYHLVYLTRNLINGKIYIGKHSTTNLDDGYLGSGKHLKLAFKKYGRENFRRTILHYCLTEQDAYDIEAQIVTKEFIKLRSNYNHDLGGRGQTFATHEKTPEHLIFLSHRMKLMNETNANKTYEELYGEEKAKTKKKRISETQKGVLKNFSEETLLAFGNRSKEMMTGKTFEEIFGKEKAEILLQNMSINATGDKNPFYGRHHTEKTCQSISLKAKERMKDRSKLHNIIKILVSTPDGVSYSYLYGLTDLSKHVGISKFIIKHKLDDPNFSITHQKKKFINGWKFSYIV